jgi:manganese transport protein
MTPAASSAVAPGVAVPGADTSAVRPQPWRRLGFFALMGPAFVAAVAYVDPGNVATNTTAGARYGYMLVWVVVAANLIAGLVQYLSARLGLLTGQSLPELVGRRLGRPVRLGYWAQAELVAFSTDLAEVVGGALALKLLFDLPLVVGAVVTICVSMLLLVIKDIRGQSTFERVVIGMLLVVACGFLAGLVVQPPDAGAAAAGVVPHFAGGDSVVLAAGMLGATVMPHAVYLHSALARDRHGMATTSNVRRLLRVTRLDITLAMLMAGAVNLGMLLLAAVAFKDRPAAETIEEIHAIVSVENGAPIALLFAVGLLASGLASTSIGSYAGAVVMEGLLHVRIPIVLRRLVTAVPALVILSLGVDPTLALVISQVILSLGIPFALIPLVRLNQDVTLLAGQVVARPVGWLGWAAVSVVVALNLVLLVLLAGG